MEFDYSQLRQPEQIQQERSQDDNDPTERLLADSRVPAAKGANAMQTSDQGQIASMDIPANWIKLPPRDQPMSAGTSVDFKLPDGGELSISERGQRISEYGGEQFRRTLDKPFQPGSTSRTLDPNGADGELPGLRAVLSDLSNSNKFKIEEARVRDINGKRVLEVSGSRGYRDDDGTWTDSGTKVHNIYIDKFGKGDAIQEIRLTAPQQHFDALSRQFNSTLETIKWK